MLERQTSAKAAKSVFYEDFNDIDIFIEDTATGYRKIFKELLKKVFENELKVDQIFPLGSRNEVIEECSKDQIKRNRKRVYIIDGDLFLLHNEVNTDLKGLFILPRYCIENYIIQENAILHVMYEEDPEMEVRQLQERLKYSEWINNNDSLLINLFKIYALCKKHIPTEQTVSYKVSNLCKDNLGNLCEQKAEQRIMALKSKLIAKIGNELFESEYTTLTKRIENESFKMLKYVSGKDYLFPLLIARVRSMIKVSTNNLNLKIRIAQKCDFLDLNLIKNNIMQ